MKHSLLTLIAILGLASAAPAFADDSGNVQVKDKIKENTDGSYTEKGSASSSGTDANGTYTSDEKTVKAKVDKNGNGYKKVKSTSVNDPKGLFNKKKTVTTDTEKYKNGTTVTDHEKTVNGTTVEKSSETNSNQ